MDKRNKTSKTALRLKIASDICRIGGLCFLFIIIIATLSICIQNFNCMKYTEDVMAATSGSGSIPYPADWSETVYNVPNFSIPETIYGDVNIPIPQDWTETEYTSPVAETIYGDVTLPVFVDWNETVYNPVLPENETGYN